MMKRTEHLVALAVATILLGCGSSRTVVQEYGAPDPVAALSQQNVNATLYQNASAEVVWLYEQGYALARLKLDANLADPDSLPPAVIVDVDETVLDNSPYELENILAGRSYEPATWKQWTARAEAKALPGALEFLQYAASRGCEVYYITNRDADEQGATITNLAALGFPMADSAHVMTMQGTSDKTDRRASVQRKHRVVLMVGDQLTDYSQLLKDRSVDQGLPSMYRMAGELSRYFILLPNSAYGYWRDGITGRGTEEERMQRVREFIEQRVR
jgi:5'-nucleotidase (lipoprotein e(P4) family)